MKFFEIFDKAQVRRFAIKTVAKALVLVLIVSVAVNVGVERGTRITAERYEAEARQREYEAKRAEAIRQEESGIIAEAEACAKVIYGTAREHSKADQAAVVWCIINRVENAQYPNTVAEVCAQPSQFMAYSDDNPVVKDFYDVAMEQLQIWHSGGYRPITPDYIYLSWTTDEVTLRTTYKNERSTRYWTPER